MPSFHTRLTAMAGLFALLAAAPAGAVIIDDFGGGTAPATYGVTTDLFETGGVILGTERDVRASPTVGSLDYGVSGGQVALISTTATSAGNVSMSWDGVDGNFLITTGNLSVDLTDGGLSDRFILEVTSLTVNTFFETTIGFFGASFFDQNLAQPSLSSAGVFEIPFAALTTQLGAGASANAATAVRLTLSPLLGEGITIDRFCTGNASGCVSGPSTAVPEPSTWLLMAGGLALLGLRRRRRS